MMMDAPPVNHLKGGPSDREAPFCAECGQLLTGQATELTWNGAAPPWWALVLIAVGATLAITFGLSAWQATQERAGMQDTLPGQLVWEDRLEGPSVQLAALRAQAPPGLVDRYLFANQQVNRAVVETKFALAMVLLGITLVARRGALRRAEGFPLSHGATMRLSVLEPVLSTLFNGWELAEILTLSAFRLLTVAFLYLMIVRVSSGEAPTLSVVQETLDRLILIVTRLPELQ